MKISGDIFNSADLSAANNILLISKFSMLNLVFDKYKIQIQTF